MPQRNSRKTYVEQGYYHVYNRGVEKRNIFDSQQDYRVFLRYLRHYLAPAVLNNADNDTPPIRERYQVKCYSTVIQLSAYVLMPNHFHLPVKQVNASAMKEFLQSLSTRYSVYFNKRYNRVGSLFQGRYKAVMVKTDEQLIHLTRYIHLNPVDLGVSNNSLRSFPYSSYANYLGKRDQVWVSPKVVSEIFGGGRSGGRSFKEKYVKFVEDHKIRPSEAEIIHHLTLDS